MGKKSLLAICLFLVFFFSLSVPLSLASDEYEKKKPNPLEIFERFPRTSDLKTPDWFPNISGLIRYSLVWPNHISFDDPETELDRIFLWVEDSFFEDKFGYSFDLEYQHNKLGKYPREVWMDSGYVHVKTPIGTLKGGSVYTPFGILWDHTYYGSVIYYKGYMHDADYGTVFENTHVFTDDITLNSSLGYFYREDDLNGATVIGEGYEHLSRGERNTFAGRLNPKFKLGDNSSLSFGISALTGEVKAAEADRQAAVEADIVYNIGPVTLTSEYIFYDQDYDDKDPTLRGSLIMAEAYWDIYKNEKAKLLKNIALRYNFSRDYPEKKGSGLGRLHLPAISIKLIDNFKVDIIHVDWRSGNTQKDRSWRVILYLNF